MEKVKKAKPVPKPVTNKPLKEVTIENKPKPSASKQLKEKQKVETIQLEVESEETDEDLMIVKESLKKSKRPIENTNETLKIINSIAQLLQINNHQEISINALKNKSQDVEEWFKTYERLAAANDWSVEKKGRKLSSFLREQALECWEDIPKKYRFDYEVVKGVLIRKLTPEFNTTDDKERFFALKQANGEPIEEYSARAKKLASKIDVLSEEAKVQRFVKGLRGEIKVGMAIAKPKKLREVIKLAECIERSLSETKEYQINSVASEVAAPKGQSEVICYN